MPYKDKRDKARNAKKWREENKDSIQKNKAEWYIRNREYLLSKAKTYREENAEKVAQCKKDWYNRRRDIVLEIKKASKCVRCGISDFRVLDFHHLVPEDKLFDISAGIVTRTVEEIICEIEKCEILCANCHRIFHYEDRLKG